MLQLIKRHWILTAFCLFCILLIVVGWSVRPDMQPSPSPAAPEVKPTSNAGPAAAGEPNAATRAPKQATGDCEIPADWLLPSDDSAEEMIDARLERVAAFAESRFASSRNPDELVFYALLADQDGKALSRFEEEIDAGSRSPYLVWKAVNRCLSRNGSEYACPRSRWIDLQTQLDGDNSEVWMRSAGLRFAQGDDAAGIAALERAANATRTEDYFARDLGVIVSGAEASGEVSRYEAARLALGLSASVLPAYEYHSYACLDPGIADAYRVQLCAQYAANVQSRPASNIVSITARSIEVFALQAAGKTAQVEALEARVLQDRRTALRGIPDEQAREFLERLNPELLYEYLADFAAYGEREAQARRVRRLDEAGLEAFQLRCRNEFDSYRDAMP